MSRENEGWKKLAEAVIGAFNQRELPTLLGFFTRDAVLQEHPDFSPNPGTYRGWLEIANYWESYDRAWADLRVEIEELRFTADNLVALTRFRARGKVSGVPIETPVILVATVSDDKLSRIDFHLDRNKALEAAGLRE